MNVASLRLLPGTARVKETPRDLAFCNYAIDPDLETDIFLVQNAPEDPRFCTNALVTGFPYIKFYAGAPLKFVTDRCALNAGIGAAGGRIKPSWLDVGSSGQHPLLSVPRVG